MKHGHWRAGLGAKLLLVAGGAVLALVAGELVLRVGMRALPVRLHGFFDEGIRVLAQRTKHGLVPHDTIALVGDSHALGLGDGFGDRARSLSALQQHL